MKQARNSGLYGDVERMGGGRGGGMVSSLKSQYNAQGKSRQVSSSDVKALSEKQRKLREMYRKRREGRQ